MLELKYWSDSVFKNDLALTYVGPRGKIHSSIHEIMSLKIFIYSYASYGLEKRFVKYLVGEVFVTSK